VVDDDADCRETVAAVLEPEGYDVVLLQNGDEALEYVRNIGLTQLPQFSRPDAVFSTT